MMTRDRAFRVLIILGIIAVSIVIIGQLWQFGQTISGILSVLAGAWFLSLILRPFIVLLRSAALPGPLVRWVRRRFGDHVAHRAGRLRIPAGVAVAVVYITALILVAGTATVGIATIIEQITGFSARLPELSAAFPRQISAVWTSIARQFDFDPNAINLLISPEEASAQIRQVIGSAAQQALSLAAGTATLVWQILLMLILSFFITTEGRLLQRQLLLVVPRSMHETLRAGITAMDESFSGYLRGYLLASLIRGMTTISVCSAFGINFGVVIALQYAILSLIPLLGSPIGILVATLVALVVRPEAALPVGIILLVLDQVVAYIILPRILRATVGVPGLVGLVSVTIGVQLFGFWGLVFSVPFMGAVYALVFDFYLARKRKAEGLPALDRSLREVAPPSPREAAPPGPASPAPSDTQALVR